MGNGISVHNGNTLYEYNQVKYESYRKKDAYDAYNKILETYKKYNYPPKLYTNVYPEK